MTAKADLHVHSKHSNPGLAGPLLTGLAPGPERLSQNCRQGSAGRRP